MLPSIRYTLCFLTHGDHILMLHRNRPPNQGLWNGVGGRLEPDVYLLFLKKSLQYTLLF